MAAAASLPAPGCDKITSQLHLEGNSECFSVCQKLISEISFGSEIEKSDLIRSDWFTLISRIDRILPFHFSNQFVSLFPLSRFQTPFHLGGGNWRKEDKL